MNTSVAQGELLAGTDWLDSYVDVIEKSLRRNGIEVPEAEQQIVACAHLGDPVLHPVALALLEYKSNTFLWSSLTSIGITKSRS
jgi:hypothetical protein